MSRASVSQIDVKQMTILRHLVGTRKRVRINVLNFENQRNGKPNGMSLCNEQDVILIERLVEIVEPDILSNKRAKLDKELITEL